MEIFPSDYQQLDLDRHEKVFVRHASIDEEFGFVLLRNKTAPMRVLFCFDAENHIV